MRADEPAPDFDDDKLEGFDYISFVGTVGPYYPYDPEDPRAPVREKRSPGFVTADDYVRGGVVREYKRKRRAR